MSRQFTAVYKKKGKWYLAWIKEMSGVNTQGLSLEEVKRNLKEALLLVLEAQHILREKEL